MGVRVSSPHIRRMRSRVLYYLLLGYSYSEIVSKVALGFGCSERTVKRDLGRMNEWIGSLLPLDDSGIQAYKRVDLDYKGLYQVIYSILDSSINASGSVYALRVLLRISSSQFKLLKISGILEQYRRYQEYERKAMLRNDALRIFRELRKKYENEENET